MLIWSRGLPWLGLPLSSSLILLFSPPCTWLSGLQMKVHQILWVGQYYRYLPASPHNVPSAFTLLENENTPQLPSLGSRVWSGSLQWVTLCHLLPPYGVDLLNTPLPVVCCYHLLTYISHSLSQELFLSPGPSVGSGTEYFLNKNVLKEWMRTLEILGKERWVTFESIGFDWEKSSSLC